MVRFMRYQKIFRLYESLQPFLKYSLSVEKKLPAKKVLVIAPHQDDEAIGCGGTVHKHVKSGGKAAVIYCAGGSEARKEEASLAAGILGFQSETFMNYKDDSLASQKAFAADLQNLIASNDPEILFVPFLLDNHSDHRAVNEALIKMEKNITNDFMVYAYPVWMPVYPNVLIDISEEWEAKKKAINCYKSQTATRDYVKMSRSLGEYWATVKGGGLQMAESFFRASYREYVKLGKKILG